MITSKHGSTCMQGYHYACHSQICMLCTPWAESLQLFNPQTIHYSCRVSVSRSSCVSHDCQNFHTMLPTIFCREHALAYTKSQVCCLESWLTAAFCSMNCNPSDFHWSTQAHLKSVKRAVRSTRDSELLPFLWQDISASIERLLKTCMWYISWCEHLNFSVLRTCLQ